MNNFIKYVEELPGAAEGSRALNTWPPLYKEALQRVQHARSHPQHHTLKYYEGPNPMKWFPAAWQLPVQTLKPRMLRINHVRLFRRVNMCASPSLQPSVGKNRKSMKPTTFFCPFVFSPPGFIKCFQVSHTQRNTNHGGGSKDSGSDKRLLLSRLNIKCVVSCDVAKVVWSRFLIPEVWNMWNHPFSAVCQSISAQIGCVHCPLNIIMVFPFIFMKAAAGSER